MFVPVFVPVFVLLFGPGWTGLIGAGVLCTWVNPLTAFMGTANTVLYVSHPKAPQLRTHTRSPQNTETS